jgi:hypothetical protein
MRSYNPAEFLSKLSVNELPDPTEVTIVGLARSDERFPSAIHFTTSLSCDKWLSIPIEIIESIDHLKTITCNDHQHPLVKIKFKRPDEARQDLAFFLNLLSQMQNLLSRALSAARAGTNSRTPADECYIVDMPGGLGICCWYGNELDCGGIV